MEHVSEPPRRRPPAEHRPGASALTAAPRNEPAEAEHLRVIDALLARVTSTPTDEGPADEPEADPDEPDDLAPLARPGLTPRQAFVRAAVATVSVLVFASTAVQYTVLAQLDGAVRQVAALDPGSGAVVDAAAQDGDDNVLVLGADPADPAAGATVVLAHLPAGGGPVAAVGIPADLVVNRPPCERWDPAAGGYLDETVPAQARVALISAFEVGGPRCATRVVQQLTGLEVTRFVALDPAGIGGLIDAVAGVSVCFPQPVVDGVVGEIVPAGPIVLDGDRAGAIAAAVVGEPDADRGAVQRQQRLLAAALERLVSVPVLLDPRRSGDVGPALGATLTTDGADLQQVLAVARTLRDLGSDAVAYRAVPASGEADALFDALRTGGPLPDPVQRPTPGDVPVQILNAADRTGLAADVGDTLAELGFAVGEVGNAPAPAARTVVRFAPDRAAAAELLAEAVPSATSVPDPAAGDVVQLVLGTSFDDVVQAPQQAAAPSSACE